MSFVFDKHREALLPRGELSVAGTWQDVAACVVELLRSRIRSRNQEGAGPRVSKGHHEIRQGRRLSGTICLYMLPWFGFSSIF